MSNSKPWGGIGAWAAEAERAEAEEAEAEAAAAKAAPTPAESQSFPSLKEAVSTKSKKKKMSLSEFTMGSYSSTSSSAAGGGGLTPDEMRRLPTGPKQRSAEEMQQGRLGGGFSNYGRSGPPPRIRDDTDGSWSGGGGGGGGGGRRSYGGFDEDRRGPPPRVTDFDQPSRADEVENWALAKKSLPSFDSGRQNQNQNQNRYASLGGGSRADEVDNWTAGKKPIQPRSSNFGSGYRDSGPEPDRWGRGVGVGGGGGGGFREVERERPRLVLDPPKGETGLSEPVKTNRSNPFGEARPREEVLAEKGLDWKKLDSEIEAKKVTSRPTSGHSSRPSSAQSTRSEGVENVVVKPRPKVNPFGDAKPREVLLEERGEDWRKIDLQLEHRRVDRPETEEEKMLKEEIDHLKEHAKEFTMKANRESLQGSSEDQTSINDIILQKENQLETLIRDLDDKVRFGQKAIERPGSGSSRAAGFPERPPSQSGSFEESRNMEFMDRPRSRGTADVWTRPVDERRAFQGGRERGFLGSRDLDRPRSRERW